MSRFRAQISPSSLSAWLLLAVFFWACAPAASGESADKASAGGNISVQEARNLLADPPQGLIILDVRTPEEFSAGHLAGARNMDFFGGQFERQMAELPKDAPLLLYCRTGRRSAAAAEALGKAGKTRIFHMHQGIQGWKEAGLPLEK